MTGSECVSLRSLLARVRGRFPERVSYYDGMTAEQLSFLERHGFEEVEPGLIEDTPENRQRLAEMRWSWERDRDAERQLTGFLIPIDPDTILQERIAQAEAKRHFLSNPDDPWSDFKHPNDISVDLKLPTWVRGRLRKWREDEQDGVPESERRPFPTRCTNRKHDGSRCWNWVNRPEDNPRCATHTNKNKAELRNAAAYSRQQLIDLLPATVDNIAYLAFNAEGEAVRLKANTEIMDRAGLRAGVEIDVTGHIEAVDPAQALRDRLSQLSKRAETEPEPEEAAPALPAPAPDAEIVDAEIVEDEETPNA